MAEAYALFQGLRSSESAQWCAENFHKKILPFLAERIHTYDAAQLKRLLERTLEALDKEILRRILAKQRPSIRLVQTKVLMRSVAARPCSSWCLETRLSSQGWLKSNEVK